MILQAEFFRTKGSLFSLKTFMGWGMVFVQGRSNSRLETIGKEGPQKFLAGENLQMSINFHGQKKSSLRILGPSNRRV